MKTKEEILKEAYLDIMYSAKTPKEVLEQVYEYAFANGFKQGNDNAKEVAEFEKKKEALQKGTTICGQDYKCKKDYKEGNCWYIKDVIYHCNRDGYLIDQNGISWSCTPEWFREHIQSNTEWAEEEKSHFVSGQFIRCKLSFDEFKEGEHYWLEYVGDDMYVGRSDNILNQKFHITPRQLFTLFSQELEEVQGPPQEEKQVSLTHEPPFNENPSDREIIEALIHHLNEQDGFLTAINCVSTKAILSWLKKQKEEEGYEAIPVESTLEYKLGFKAGKESEKQKEQKHFWNPTEEDVALFNKVVTTNTTLTPQERAKLDIIRMKFKHCPYIEQQEQKPAEWNKPRINGKPIPTENQTVDIPLAEWNDNIIQKAVKEVGLTQHQIDWFKTNVFPPKQEWSKEDYQLIGFIFDLLNSLVWRKDWAMDKKKCLDWLKSLSERFILEPDKQNQEVNLDHFKSYMLQYLQDAANRKDDSEIEKDTDIWANKLLTLIFKK